VGRVARPAYFDIAEVRFCFFFQSFFLDDLAQVEVAFKMSFFFGSLVDAFLVLALSGLAVFHFEDFVVIELGHLVGIFEEILFQIPQLLLDYCFSFVLVDLPDRR
jgi:hypothetical protein